MSDSGRPIHWGSTVSLLGRLTPSWMFWVQTLWRLTCRHPWSRLLLPFQFLVLKSSLQETLSQETVVMYDCEIMCIIRWILRVIIADQKVMSVYEWGKVHCFRCNGQYSVHCRVKFPLHFILQGSCRQIPRKNVPFLKHKHMNSSWEGTHKHILRLGKKLEKKLLDPSGINTSHKSVWL